MSSNATQLGPMSHIERWSRCFGKHRRETDTNCPRGTDNAIGFPRVSYRQLQGGGLSGNRQCVRREQSRGCVLGETRGSHSCGRLTRSCSGKTSLGSPHFLNEGNSPGTDKIRLDPRMLVNKFECKGNSPIPIAAPGPPVPWTSAPAFPVIPGGIGSAGRAWLAQTARKPVQMGTCPFFEYFTISPGFSGMWGRSGVESARSPSRRYSAPQGFRRYDTGE